MTGKLVFATFFAFIVCATALPTQHEKVLGDRIVGGVEARAHQYPSIVDMRRVSGGITYHSCGGSIVNKDWIVTAAHCATGTPTSYEIVAGEHNITVEEGTEQRRQVERIITHEAYRPGVYENDIALMKVTPPFELNQYVQEAVLPQTGYVVSGDTVPVGWGRLSSGGLSPDVLMHVSVPFVDDTGCRQAYGQSAIYDTMICAGHKDGGKDACQGDSGGPLNHLNTRDGKEYLVGLTSWGYGCAAKEYPGVYTEVSFYYGWIQTNIAK